MNLTEMMNKGELSSIKSSIQPGIYKHYKGNLYEVIAIGRHSETLEEMVIYKACYGDGEFWVRPASMWEEEVKPGVKRFEFIMQEL